MKSNILPRIEVNTNNGKVHIDGQHVNYSFGSLHHVFRKAIRIKNKEISRAKSALILGFGAGSIARILWNERNYDIAITGVDFEPVMFELAEKYAGIQDFEKLDLVNADAKEYMAQCKGTFDVIFIDLFIEDRIPEFCLSEAFLRNVRKAVNPAGLMVWNTLMKDDLRARIEKLSKLVGFDLMEVKKPRRENQIFFIK